MKSALLITPCRRRFVSAARAGALLLALAAPAWVLAQQNFLPATTPVAPAPVVAANFALTAPAEGQVLAAPMRERLLAAVTRSLDRANPGMKAQLLSATNPFFQPLPPAPVAPSPEDVGPSATPKAPVITKLTDADKLSQLNDQLHPTGEVVIGQSHLLSTPQGSVAVGQSITVTFPNETTPTRVLIKAADEDTYTLRLNDTENTFLYYNQPSKGTPTVTPPAPPAPPAPAPAH